MSSLTSDRAAGDHRFIPADLPPGDIAALAALYKSLEARPLPDKAALETWIADWEDLSAVAGELFTEAYVAMTCDTGDPQREATYLHLVEELVPLMERSRFALQRKLLDTPAVAELDPAALPGLRFEPQGARRLRGIGEVEVFSVATAG